MFVGLAVVSGNLAPILDTRPCRCQRRSSDERSIKVCGIVLRTASIKERLDRGGSHVLSIMKVRTWNCE